MLENCIEYAAVMTVQDVITGDLLLPSQEEVNERLKSLKSAKEAFEKDYLIQLIELTQGNVSQAAKLAGKYRVDLGCRNQPVLSLATFPVFGTF